MTESDFPLPTTSTIGWHQASAETDDRLTGDIKRSEITAIMKAPPTVGMEGWIYRNLKINTGLAPEEQVQRQAVVDAMKKDRGNISRIGRDLVRTGGFAGFINVMSEKGGCGKTTLVSLLAYELDAIRRDSVVVTDLNPDKGSLYSRMGVEPNRSLRDLLISFEDIQAGRAHTRDFLAPVPGTSISVLSGERDPEKREKTSEVDVIKVFQLLSPLTSLAILDNGTGITHSALAGSLQVSHAMALIMENTLDAETFIHDTLTFLQKNNHDDLRKRLILVINDKAAITAEESAELINNLMLRFSHQVRGIVVVPFDRSLAKSGPINFQLVGDETRKAIRHLAALLVDDMIR